MKNATLTRLGKIMIVDAVASMIAESALARLRLGEYSEPDDNQATEDAIRFAVEDAVRAYLGAPRRRVSR